MSESREKIRLLNAELDQFVYHCYHNLRAPVATTLGLINLINSTNAEEETYDYINLIHENILKLDQRIKDVIDYSKNSRMRLKREKIELVNLIDENIEVFRQELESHSINPIVKVKKGFDLFTDRIRLNIILNSLLSNAINFQNKNSENKIIKVEGQITLEKLVIQVTDNGIGIGPQELDNVCEMFYKGSIKSSGAGLGLYIANQSVIKLNGSLDIDSDSNKGTVVTVSIPNLT